MTPEEFRALSAADKFEFPTAGYCPGFVQANLAAFPKQYAADFKTFCKANPKPCPLLEVIGPDTCLSQKLAPGADIRDVIPRYQIWHDGVCTETVSNLRTIDTTDFVYFLLGCSFSFEEALIEAGIYLRHVDQKKNVAMYRTNIKLESVGVFAGNMVVSMRPIRRDQVEEASRITGMFPDVHGAPVHVGDPGKIGIVDINTPDYGEFVEIKDDEVPVFWACGVTPQNVLRSAKLPFAITHAPGFMFVSDIRNKDYAFAQ